MAAVNKPGLRPVKETELQALKERLVCHLPYSLPVYGGVSLAVRYGLHSLQPACILVPADPRPACLTIIAPVTSGEPVSIQVFWSTEEHTPQEVAHYLSHIPHLDWEQPVCIRVLPSILLPSLQSLGNIVGRQVQLQTVYQGHLYSFQVPATLDKELPPEYHVISLREEDAMVVWKNWYAKSFDSADSLSCNIAHFPSCGVRHCCPTDGGTSLQEAALGTLVSWVLITKIGSMGNTFTMPQHRRKGLASKANLALTRKMLQEGLLPYVYIESHNTASISFHESLGFQQQCEVHTVHLVLGAVTDQD